MKRRLVVGHKANLGLVRDTMEDAYSVKAGNLDADVRRKGSLLVVADGVGGYQAGEVASNMAANGIISGYYVDENADRMESLRTVILDTNLKIYQRAQESNYKKMSTTVVCALVLEESLILAHVGDSRAYLLRDGKLLQLTEDHSWVNEQIRQGLMTPDEVGTSPARNVITRSLGNSPSVIPEINLFGILQNQDRLLLCTDGLYELVTPSEIKPILEKLAPQQAAEALVERANRAGGADNITVIVAEFRSETIPEKIETVAAVPDDTLMDLSVPDVIENLPDDFPVLTELDSSPSHTGMVKSICTELSIRHWKLVFSFSSKKIPLSYNQKQTVKLSTGENITCGFTINEDNFLGSYPIKLDIWAEIGEKSYHRWMVGYGAMQGPEEFRLNSKTIVVFDGTEVIALTGSDPLVLLKIEKCEFVSAERVQINCYAFDTLEFSFLIFQAVSSNSL